MRRTHENVSVTRQEDGQLVTHWNDGPPKPGDFVLMSVELWEHMHEQYNQNVRADRERLAARLDAGKVPE